MTYTSDFDTLTVTPGYPIGLDRVHAEFDAETFKSGLYFGDDHSAFTAMFVAALATKPFVILSGLSGSGKTLLATAFGQWVGRDQLLLQPVRPDWTSPEALLGYEDRQSESFDSQHGWHVPRSLDFILKAAHNPDRPYVLILDEMNLAHVEMYFADVLSGMESNQPMVPNLQRDAHGWRMPPRDAEYIAWPKNLFTIGTINVDETTYAFSPKVLDRASVVEFRVAPDSIRLDSPRLEQLQRADSATSDAFLKRAQGEEMAWAGRETIGTALQAVHRILYAHNAEFGHRVVRESLRFASMMNEVGLTDMPNILDHIMVQRIIPKLELASAAPNADLIRALTVFASKPALPQTLAKLGTLATN